MFSKGRKSGMVIHQGSPSKEFQWTSVSTAIWCNYMHEATGLLGYLKGLHATVNWLVYPEVFDWVTCCGAVKWLVYQALMLFGVVHYMLQCSDWSTSLERYLMRLQATVKWLVYQFLNLFGVVCYVLQWSESSTRSRAVTCYSEMVSQFLNLFDVVTCHRSD